MKQLQVAKFLGETSKIVPKDRNDLKTISKNIQKILQSGKFTSIPTLASKKGV